MNVCVIENIERSMMAEGQIYCNTQPNIVVLSYILEIDTYWIVRIGYDLI